MTDLALLYPSMPDPAADAAEAPPSLHTGFSDAQLRNAYPSMFEPPPTVRYPSMVEHVEPFVDPGNDPASIRAAIEQLLHTPEGRDALYEEIDRGSTATWARNFERLGLGDNLQLRSMLRALNMYPSMRSRK